MTETKVGPTVGPEVGSAAGPATGVVDESRLVAGVVEYAILGLDAERRVESWNAGCRALTGLESAAALGRRLEDLGLLPEAQSADADGARDASDAGPAALSALLARAGEEGRAEELGWWTTPGGDRFWGDLVVTEVRGAHDDFRGWTLVLRDLTEQHELDQLLREREDRFRNLVGQVVDYAIIALDAHGRVESWNAGAERVKGYAAREVLGRSFAMFYTGEDQQSGLPQRLLDQARERGRVEHEGWRVRKDGARFWADVVITALRDEGGEVVGYAKVTRDLTEQHLLQATLRESEARFRTLVEQVVDYAIIALDEHGRVQTWNAGAHRLKGYTEDEALGRPFTTFYTPQDQHEGLPQRLLDAARRDGRVEHEGWRVRKDGTLFWADVVITALRGPDGRVRGFSKVTRDLTEQHKLALELTASEERFRTLVGHVVDYAIIGLDPLGRITSWNAGARALKGYEEPEALGQSFTMFYTPQAQQDGVPMRLLQQAVAEGRATDQGWRVRKDGSLFWADVVITALHDQEGRLTGFSKVTRDQTEQRALLDSLAESEERFRTLVAEVVDYAIISLDADGRVQTWNAGAARLKGYTETEIHGRSFTQFYTPEDQRDGLPQRLLDTARRDGRVQHQGWRVKKDGSLFWADLTLTALHGPGGEVIGFSKVTRDLTEQHGLHTALAESEQRFRTMVTQVVDYAIIALDANGRVESWNAGAEAVKGYREEEVLGRSVAMFYPPEDQAAGLPGRLLMEARRDGRARHQGWRIRKDGTRFWADVVLTAVRDDAGELRGYSKVTRDLTEQHALDVSLRSSEERFRTLVSQVVDYAIVALDPQGRIESWNAGAEEVFGYAEPEAVGRSHALFFDVAEQEAGEPTRLLAVAQGVGRAEHTGWRVRRDGTRFWAECVVTALRDDDQRVRGYACVTRDVSEVKRLESVRDSFYATFEHDLRTPLTAIRGFAELLRDLDDGGSAEFLARIESNVDTLLEMLGGMVEFSRVRSGETPVAPEPVELLALVRQAVGDLGPVEGPRVSVQGEPVVALADRTAFARVVRNVVGNALKYSPKDAGVEVRVDATDPHEVLVEVTDHGRGIAPEDIGSIFDEFQRGRLAEDDGGRGLGLASARHLMERQQGRIEAVSSLGEGTTMTLALPRPGRAV